MDLASLVSSLFVLASKVQSMHWMVNGPSFLEIHRLLGDQYEKLREFGDMFAEHIRILGFIPPLTMREMITESRIAEYPPSRPDWKVFIKILQSDMENLANMVNMFNTQERGINNDLDELHNWLTKQAWFLRMYNENTI